MGVTSESEMGGNAQVLLGTIAGMLFVALTPVLYLVIACGESSLWVIWGAGAWGVGVRIKALGWRAYLRDRVGHVATRNVLMGAAISGVWSGMAELGAAAFNLYLRRPENLVGVVAFGVGAGSIEAIIISLGRWSRN